MNRFHWTLVLIAILAGLALPDFYDWSGEDQSRAAPVVRWIALGILILDAVVIGWLVWKFFKTPTDKTAANRTGQFSIWQMLLAMTLVAVVVTVERTIHLPLVNGLVLVCFVYAMVLAYKQPAWRWSTATLFVCLWGPFLWIFRWPEFHGNIVQMLTMAPGLPALLPAAICNNLLGISTVSDMTTPGLFTMFEIALGLYLIRIEPHLGLSSMIVVLTVSLISSFFLNAAVRM